MLIEIDEQANNLNDEKILFQEGSPLLFELYDLNIEGTEETENSLNGQEN